MNCRTANERIHAALDARRNPLADAAVAEHAASCAACRGLIAALQMVDVALRLPIAAPPPPSLADLRPLPQQPMQPVTARRSFWAAALWLSAAAAVLLVVWPALFPPAQPNAPRPGEQIAVQDGGPPADDQPGPPPAAEIAAAEVAAEDLAILAQQAERSYRQLAADTQANVAAAWQLVPAQAFRGAAPNGGPPRGASLWDELGAELNPLAAATADSLGVLWQALPDVPAEPTERTL